MSGVRTNLSQVRRQMDSKIAGVDRAVFRTAAEIAATGTRFAKAEITGRRGQTDGVWDKATPGKPPMNRTGTLRRSINSRVYKDGFGSYTGRIEPATNYARALEVGHQYAPPSWRFSDANEGFPYMRPALNRLRAAIPGIIRKNMP